MVIKNIQNIKIFLENERSRLMHELELLTEGAGNETNDHGLINKRDEIATQRQDLEIQFVKARHIEKQLSEIEHALGKIEKGSYGLCDSCGLPIPPGRLEALPQTTQCLACKGRRVGS